MSVESLAVALHHSRAAGTAKLVLIGIANHDGDGGAWPAVATLVKYAGINDRRAVQRAIAKLEGLGEIRRIIHAGGDHDLEYYLRPNLYRFDLRCPADCDRTTRHRTTKSSQLVTFEDADADDSTSRSNSHPVVIRPGEGAVVRPPKPSLKPTTNDSKKNSSYSAENLAPCGSAWIPDRRGRTCDLGHNHAEEITA